MNPLSITKDIISIIVSSALLCFMAVYNGYPLIFNSDTAMYIDAAFRGVVPEDRTITYGLFVMFSSLHTNLWLTVIFQAIIVSMTIFYYFKYFNTSRISNFRLYYILFVAVISLFTSASFEVCWLMSDVFTGVLVLCIGLLLLTSIDSCIDFSIICLLIIVSLPMHNSNYYISLFIFFMFASGYIFPSTRVLLKIIGLKFKKILILLALIIVGKLFLLFINSNYKGNFTGSESGIIFLMSNIVEMGIIDLYLQENCEHKKLKLCQFKESIPNNFLWDSRSPIHITGGWKGNYDEYLYIIKDILSTPKYLLLFVYHSILLTFKQLCLFDTGEADKPTIRVNEVIQLYYPNHFNQYLYAKQSTQSLNFTFINFCQSILVAFSFLCYCIALFYSQIPLKHRIFIIFLFSTFLINAWLCGTFSGVYPRYQSRIIWLIPLPLFMFFIKSNNHISKDIIRFFNGTKSHL